MIPSATLLLVLSDTEPWRSAGLRTVDVLVSTAASLRPTASISVATCTSIEYLPPGMTVGDEDVVCIICHLDPHTEGPALERRDHFYWVLVSGGQHYVSDAFRAAMPPDRVIWFQGAYGREANFAFWLRWWTEAGLTATQFRSSADALLLAAVGPRLHLMRLRDVLSPLTVLLSGYAHLQAGADDSARSDADAVLSRAVAEMLGNRGILDSWSSLATLLDGYIENHKNALPSEALDLRRALYPFLPHDFGHFGEYNPKLDIDLIQLGLSPNTRPSPPEIVQQWLQRLDIIFSPEALSVFE